MVDQELEAKEKRPATPPEGEYTREGTHFVPAVDIYENSTELVLLADMPGVQTEDVDIDLRDGTLTIVGKVPNRSEHGEPLLSEYHEGNFFRTFCLTDIIDQTRITASMSDGVLKLTMPKVEKAIPRKVPIAAD